MASVAPISFFVFLDVFVRAFQTHINLTLAANYDWLFFENIFRAVVTFCILMSKVIWVHFQKLHSMGFHAIESFMRHQLLVQFHVFFLIGTLSSLWKTLNENHVYCEGSVDRHPNVYYLDQGIANGKLNHSRETPSVDDRGQVYHVVYNHHEKHFVDEFKNLHFPFDMWPGAAKPLHKKSLQKN